VSIVVEIAGNFGDLIVVFFWEDRVGLGSGETGDIEGATRSSSMRDRCRGGTDAACAETRQKRGSGVGGWGGHWNSIRGESREEKDKTRTQMDTGWQRKKKRKGLLGLQEKQTNDPPGQE